MLVSFAADIRPLFNSRDVSCMARFQVALDDYGYMSAPAGNDQFPDHANARDVLAHLTGESPPQMPMGGPFWTQAQLDLYRQWIADGFEA